MLSTKLSFTVNGFSFVIQQKNTHLLCQLTVVFDLSASFEIGGMCKLSQRLFLIL